MVHESEKTLAQRLGFQQGMLAVVIGAPDTIMKELMMLKQVQLQSALAPDADYIQYFAPDSETLLKQLPTLKKHLHPTGCLWICWPKKWSEIGKDLTEELVRKIGKKGGLSDVKITQIDETWSGMKFVYRFQDRKL